MADVENGIFLCDEKEWSIDTHNMDNLQGIMVSETGSLNRLYIIPLVWHS